MNLPGQQQKSQTVIWIQALIVLLLWCYIIYRIAIMEVTHDEAFSYLLVKTNYLKALVGTANTHWLNSIFMKIFLFLPGYDYPWKLKMLSLLCWPLYGYITIRFSESFKNRSLGILFFSVAVLNPFLIFYFTLSRGYAAACTFIILSLWMARKRVVSNNMHPAVWVPVFVVAALAVAANFTALYFFLALALIYILQLFIQNKTGWLRSRKGKLWMAITGAVVLGSIADLLFIKYYTHDLEFGSDQDPAGSLFGSTLQETVFLKASPYVFHLAGLVIGFCLLAASVYSILRHIKTLRLTVSFLAVYAAVAIVGMNIFFHIVFHTPYLINRTTLILFVITMLALFTTLDTAFHVADHRRILPETAVAILLLLGVFNFYKTSKLKGYYDWNAQSTTKECLDYAQSIHADTVGLNPWHFAVYVNYYKRAYPGKYTFAIRPLGLDQLHHLNDTSRFTGMDALLLTSPYPTDSGILNHWILRKYFPNSEAIILTPKRKRGAK